MEETRALLKYKLPLNEIIYDFFDALRSRSEDMHLWIMSSAVMNAVNWLNLISLLIRKKLMHFLSSYMQILLMSVDVRCVRS
mgnify:FL=1